MQPEKHKTIHVTSSAISALSFSPSGVFLAVASHDCCVNIYVAARGYRYLCRCVGHSATINSVDWSMSESYLRTTSNANEILYFEAKSGRLVNANFRDERWNDWTSLLGFEVMGVWQEGSDPSDLNSCNANQQRTLIAVGTCNLSEKIAFGFN